MRRSNAYKEAEKINKWIRDFIETAALLALKEDYLKKIESIDKRLKKKWMTFHTFTAVQRWP